MRITFVNVGYGDAAVNFEYDIKSRGLTLYRHKPEEGAV